MTDKSGTHYHKYATRSEHNTSPPPVSSCRSPTTATVQRHDQAIIPNARLDTTTSGAETWCHGMSYKRPPGHDDIVYRFGFCGGLVGSGLL